MWGILHLALTTYIFIIVVTFWPYWFADTKSCVRNLSMFIIGCAYIYGFQLVRKIVLIFLWKAHKDPGPVQAKIDFWFIIFVVIPELVLYILGNCILY
jgi:hypothetical protein